MTYIMSQFLLYKMIVSLADDVAVLDTKGN
jgi:hypothetical protein